MDPPKGIQVSQLLEVFLGISKKIFFIVSLSLWESVMLLRLSYVPL